MSEGDEESSGLSSRLGEEGTGVEVHHQDLDPAGASTSSTLATPEGKENKRFPLNHQIRKPHNLADVQTTGGRPMQRLDVARAPAGP